MMIVVETSIAGCESGRVSRVKFIKYAASTDTGNVNIPPGTIDHRVEISGAKPRGVVQIGNSEALPKHG